MTTVIFACVHNAGRSQMAAAFFNHLADPARVRAQSAGTRPGDRVHPEVAQVMAEIGIDLSSARPQQLTPDLAASARWLVTMGCGDECPHVPGLTRDDWPLEDPKGKPLARVREIRDTVRARVAAFIAREAWRPIVPADIRRATGGDLLKIQELLEAAHLPIDGARQGFDTGFVIDIDGRIVAAAALECYAEGALLRSVAVDAGLRGQHLGERVTLAAVEEASRRGLPAIYLLTTTAHAFFNRFGFIETSRAAVPRSVQQSVEFQSACPASAAVLALSLR